MKVISLGWGVQSFALAAMSALGVLPQVDAAIHADTGHERAEIYALAEKWTPWMEERGVRVVTVQDKMIPYQFDKKGIFLPLYLRYGQDVYIDGYSNEEDEWIEFESPRLLHTKGTECGTLFRQCTQRWKIAPIRKWARANRNGDVVEMWLGITLDEVARMKLSDVLYIKNVYPFIDMLDYPWTRGDVLRWLHDNGLDIPVKSACVFCPYHDRATWREIQLSGNGDWEKALEVDAAIRDKRPGYLCYLTSQRKPLAECDFRSQEDHGQLTLWDAEECSGMCFL